MCGPGYSVTTRLGQGRLRDFGRRHCENRGRKNGVAGVSVHDSGEDYFQNGRYQFYLRRVLWLFHGAFFAHPALA